MSKHMTEEEKIAAETAETETEVTETEEENADADSEEGDATKVDNEIDFEAELSKEREAREKAEAALASDRYKAAERKRKEGKTEDVEEVDDDKPLTAKQLRELLATERQESDRKLQSVQISSIAKKLAGSDAEANLIIEIHKNRTFPGHLSLEDQLEEAYVIANRKKIIGTNKELVRALKGKNGVNKDAATTHQGERQVAGPKLPPQEVKAFLAAGYVLNKTSGNYEKKLPSGDILVRDSKTRQTKLVKKAR